MYSINLLTLTLAFAFGANISLAEPVNKSAEIRAAKPVESLTIKANPAKKAPITLDNKIAIDNDKLPNHPAGEIFGSGPGKADLIIKPFYQGGSLPHPGHSYCEASPSGGASKHIWFFIKNTGNAASEPSLVKVFFNTFVGGGTSGIDQQNIPAIAVGGSSLVKVAMPKGCYPDGFSTSCHFRIVADATYLVQENNESNNHIDDRCVNPAG